MSDAPVGLVPGVSHNVLPHSPEPPIAPETASNVGEDNRGEAPSLETIFSKLSPRHAAYLARVMIAQNRAPKKEYQKEIDVSANTDSSGNLIMLMYTCPAGREVRVTRVDVTLNATGTYNPSAPYAASGSYMFIARSSPSQYTTYTAAEIAALWTGQVGFAPTSSGGPILPGTFFWAKDTGPLYRDGQGVFLVINGANAIATQSLSINLRFLEREI